MKNSAPPATIESLTRAIQTISKVGIEQGQVIGMITKQIVEIQHRLDDLQKQLIKQGKEGKA